MTLDPTPLLRTRDLARALDLHDTLESTNDRAKQLAREGAPHGLLVAARAQTAGRGRLGRTWVSPPDAGVYASFVVRPAAMPLRSAPLLTLAAGVAVREAARAVSGFEGGLKWPNDLWVPSGPLMHRKVAGILTETSAAGDRLEHAVIGVGLNLREVERPPSLATIATSLEALTGKAVDPSTALAALAEALETVLDQLQQLGPAPVLGAWRRHALGVGTPVVVGEARGIMRGIAEDGALLVEGEGGVERRVYAGDLSLRPGGEPT